MQTIVTERGQISIPAAIRQRFNLKPGTSIEWQEREGGIFLFPVPEDPIGSFRQDKDRGETAALLKFRKMERKKERFPRKIKK